MATINPQLYFVIGDRIGDSTKIQGQTIFSIQKVEDTSSLRIEQAPKKDPSTGRLIEQSTPLPALNYETSVSYANPFTKEAIITISHFTKKGKISQTFKLNRKKPSATFMDENYIIKFGIDDFECIVRSTKESEVDGIIERNVDKIKNLVGLEVISILSAGGSTKESEPGL